MEMNEPENGNVENEECGADSDMESNKSQAMKEVILKELARINGRINKMTSSELIGKLKHYHLDTGGTDDVRRKRLKNNYKMIKLKSADMYLSNKLSPYYLIVDFEATCEEVNPPNFVHEIIEFPAVLINSQTQEVEATFQEYCKPSLNPHLSDFCTELTGITQEQVDGADAFPAVLARFEAWLEQRGLRGRRAFALVADGPWDTTRFLHTQCRISDIPYPPWAETWLDIRKAFANFYRSQRYCLKLMLDHLGMDFEGRPHCGLDDATNIGRILVRMMIDGASLQTNARIVRERREKEEGAVEAVGQKLVGLKLQATSKPIQGNAPNVTYLRVKRERSIKEAKMVREMIKDGQREEGTAEGDDGSKGKPKESRGKGKRRR